MKVIVQNGQNLSDIAIQEYGTLEGIIVLAKTNGISPSDALYVGQQLEVPECNFRREMKNYCKANSIRPATAENRLNGEIKLRIFTEQFGKQFK